MDTLATTQSLADALDALLTPIARDGHEIPCLLDQLEQAAESSGGSGRGRSSPQKAPCSLEVLALLSQIDAGVRSGLRAAGYRGRLDRSRTALLGACKAHAAALAARDWHAFTALTREAGRWALQARNILTPDPRTLETSAQPCPSCGQRTALTWSDDHQGRVQHPSLYLSKDDLTVYCRCCGACWGPLLWDFLRGLLASASGV